MERIYVFIYRDKADGRINEINIIAEKEIAKNCVALERNIENGITEMLLEDIQKHNADSRNKSIVEWIACSSLLGVENLLRKIRTLGDAALGESPQQQRKKGLEENRNDIHAILHRAV